jgi:adenylate cyclase
LVVRTILYSVVVAVSLSLVLSIEPATLGECSYSRCVADFLTGPLFLRDLVFSTVFVFFTTFTAQVVLLVGTRNFGRLILGKYRRPRELYAVFMFVDIRGSTAIAERLGHEGYSAFLRDFFNDISGAIHGATGEVYQYVGDEVVIVWPGDEPGGRPYWLACYEAMRAALEEVAPAYRESYGVTPEFKAGVHGGLVVVTEVGTLQRAHVYHGDVLNTASRIQAKCNEAGYDLLVSESMAAGLRSGRRQEFKRVGAIPLRGKTEEIVVYGFRAPADPAVGGAGGSA